MGRPGHVWFRTSRGRWYAKIGGKMHDLGPDRLKAEELYRQMTATAAALGFDLTPTGTPGVRPGTVAELVPRYLLTLEVSPKTLTDYRGLLGWLVRHFGTLRPDQLTTDEVQAAARSAGWTANTRRQTLAVVQGFVKWCGLKDFKLRYPAAQSRGDETVLNPDEFGRILAHARGDYHPLFRFLWEVGCRPGEACSLTVDVVSWDAGTARLHEHKTARKGKSRVLYLTGEALAVLVAQRAKHNTGHLFRGPTGRPVTSVRAGVAFSECAKLAGVTGKVLYSLRHAYATRALEAGITDSDVAALLGHSNTAMLHKTYSHLTANSRRLRDIAGRIPR